MGPDANEGAMSTNDDEAEALMRSLFAEGGRPPMGDEAFVKGVMARVDADVQRAKVWRSAAIPGVAALGVAVFWPFMGPVAALLGQIAQPILQNAPNVGAGGLTLLMAAAAAGGALVYAERT